jgi:hypothetical protein
MYNFYELSTDVSINLDRILWFSWIFIKNSCHCSLPAFFRALRGCDIFHPNKCARTTSLMLYRTRGCCWIGLPGLLGVVCFTTMRHASRTQFCTVECVFNLLRSVYIFRMLCCLQINFVHQQGVKYFVMKSEASEIWSVYLLYVCWNILRF